MKIRALKTLVGEYGRLAKGDIADLPNWQARPLLALGYVEIATEPVNVEAPVAPRKRAKHGKSKSK